MNTRKSQEEGPGKSICGTELQSDTKPRETLGVVEDDAQKHGSPREWPQSQKWAATFILSGFAFIQPLAETMLTPVQQPLSQDLSITEGYQWVLVNSLILIGVGLGPLVLAPFSEMYGRRPAILVGSALFIVWNTSCGFAQNLGQMLAFRLLAGFGACTADAVAGGVLGDLWEPEHRGRAFAVYMAAPLLGPGVGPIVGAYIATSISWRWTFWITSIATTIILGIALLLLEETYEPRLAHLRRKQASSAEDVENGALPSGTPQDSIAAIGYVIGVQIAGHLSDKIYSILKARAMSNKGRPEFRVPVMAIGTFLIPAGLLWWGWTGERRLHWILPNIGCGIFTAGCYICSSCVSVYTIDAYTTYAASAVSTNLVLRSIFAAFFPIFAPYMFGAVGFGWGATILAGGFGVVGFGTLVILWFCGEAIRERSRYCAAGDE